MRPTRRNIGKKVLKVYEVGSDGRGGSKLNERRYIPPSPSKSHSSTSASPRKKQKIDEVQEPREDERMEDELREDDPFMDPPDFSDARPTKVRHVRLSNIQLPHYIPQGQHDYLEEFVLHHRQRFLDRIVAREAPREGRICKACSTQEVPWRCLDCLGQPSFCRECCAKEHAANPFHRVASWQETHYSPDWLWATGVRIHLGHAGEPCPHADEGTGDTVFAQATVRNFKYNAEPLGKQLEGDTVVTIVHTNGIHHLPVALCRCPGREDKVLDDYLDLGLFPASFQSVQTAFTFSVLDDNMLAYLECHTTSNQYYQKLRRSTNPAFPDSVPVRISFPRTVFA